MKRYFLLTVLTTLLFGSNAYGTENDPTKLNRWDLIFPYKGLAKITLNTLASAFNSSDDNDFSPTNFSTSANVNNTKIVSNHIGSKTIETEKTVDNSTVLDSQKTLQNNTQKIPTTIVKPNEDLENFAKKFKISLKDSDYKHKNKKMVKKHISNIQLLIEEYKVNPPFSVNLCLQHVKTLEKMYAKEKEKIAFLKKVYQDKELLPEIQQRLFKDEIHIKKIVQYVDSLINTANVENVNLKHLNFVVRMHANEINSLLRLKQKQLKKNTYTDKPIPHKRKIRHLKEFQEDYQSINPFSSLITTIKQLKQKQN